MQRIRKAISVLSHLLVILSLMFLVFVILDQFNPMMNFVNNGISTVLLILWSVLCVTENLLIWKLFSTRDDRP